MRTTFRFFIFSNNKPIKTLDVYSRLDKKIRYSTLIIQRPPPHSPPIKERLEDCFIGTILILENNIVSKMF